MASPPKRLWFHKTKGQQRRRDDAPPYLFKYPAAPEQGQSREGGKRPRAPKMGIFTGDYLVQNGQVAILAVAVEKLLSGAEGAQIG